MVLRRYIRKQTWCFSVIKILQEYPLILTCEISKRNEFLNGALYYRFSEPTKNNFANLLNFIKYKNNKEHAIYELTFCSNVISSDFNFQFTKSKSINFSKVVAKLLQLKS